MTHRDVATTLGVLFAGLLCACSRTHDGKGRNEPAAGTDANAGATVDAGGAGGAQAGMQAQVAGAGSGGVGGGAGEDEDTDLPPDGTWTGDFPLPPLAPEVAERFKALQEPDFEATPDELAEMNCGSTLRIDERTEVGEALAEALVEVTRAFDGQGRLLVAEEHTTVTGSPHLILEVPNNDSATRLQLDYDDRGRVIRVRQGALDEWRDEHGTVIDFTYFADGNFVADMATTHVYEAEQDLVALPPRGFCERMEFDAVGQLVRTSWGCKQSQEARTFSYDDEGRPLEVKGRKLMEFVEQSIGDPRFGESREWSIRYRYDTPGEVSVVWNELDLRGETPVEVEQRLVRRFDSVSRPVATEFDYGNDGTLDERADYSFGDAGSQIIGRTTYDFGVDEVIDMVWERRRQGDTDLMEQRHMAQWGDENRFHYSIGHFYALLSSGRHSSTPQSLSRWTLRHDAEDRVVEAALHMRLVPMPGTTDSSPQEVTSSLVQRFGGAGNVEHVAVDASALKFIILGDPPELTPSRRETTCNLQSACAGGTAILPADPALAACQTDSGAASRVVLPSMHSPYVPPPFDRIEAMRTRHDQAATFDPRPPTVREIVGY